LGSIVYNAQPSASDATLVTPASDTIISGILAVNATGTDRTLTLHVTRAASGTDEPIVTSLPVPANSAVPVIDKAKLAYGGVLLRAAHAPYSADLLKGSASAATSITLIAYQ
jgi:hypothetical protein